MTAERVLVAFCNSMIRNEVMLLFPNIPRFRSTIEGRIDAQSGEPDVVKAAYRKSTTVTHKKRRYRFHGDAVELC